MTEKAMKRLVGLASLCVLCVLVPAMLVSVISQESVAMGKVLANGRLYTIRSNSHWFFGRRDLEPSLHECSQREYDTLSVPELVIQTTQPQEPEQ